MLEKLSMGNYYDREGRYLKMLNVKLCNILPSILKHLIYRQGIYISVVLLQKPYEKQIIKGLCMELDCLLREEENNLKEICDKIEISEAKIEEIFENHLINGIREEINWYKVLMYLSFVGEMTVRYLNQQMKQMREYYGRRDPNIPRIKRKLYNTVLHHVEKNIQKYLMSWIDENGGWEIFIKETTKVKNILSEFAYQTERTMYNILK